jgi:hypothetical protein
MEFYKLDETKCALKVLHVLYLVKKTIPRGELFQEFKKVGVGRSLVYKAINVLSSLGLVDVTPVRLKGKRSVWTQITSWGCRIMERILELDVILSRAKMNAFTQKPST